MKKKNNKENVFKKYGLDIPNKVVTEAEMLIDHDTIERQSFTIEYLIKEVKELKKYQKLWEAFKKIDIKISGGYECDECGSEKVIQFTETVEHEFDSVREYIEFMEEKILKEKEKD